MPINAKYLPYHTTATNNPRPPHKRSGAGRSSTQPPTRNEETPNPRRRDAAVQVSRNCELQLVQEGATDAQPEQKNSFLDYSRLVDRLGQSLGLRVDRFRRLKLHALAV